MKVQLNKLEIKEGDKRNLPIFYNFISYNNFQEMEGADEKISFSKDLNCYIDHPPPTKQISKIIDFSKIS